MNLHLISNLQDVIDRRGLLTPQILVDEARPETSPFHDCFEWDDEVAGERYRVIQARELIRSVKIVYRDNEGEVHDDIRAFVAVRDNGAQTSYLPVLDVVQDPVSSAILLRDMEREWKAFQRRWEKYAEFREIVLRDLGIGDGDVA